MLFEYISFFFLIFTSLVGIFSIVKVITEWIFDDSEYLKKTTILTLSDNNDRLEPLLRNFLTNTNGKIIIVNCGLKESSIDIINRLIKNRSNVEVISKDNYLEYASKNELG